MDKHLSEFVSLGSLPYIFILIHVSLSAHSDRETVSVIII